MGHFRDTLMAVCSTPSSPLRVVFPDEAATLLKFLLTVGWEAQENEEGTALLPRPPNSLLQLAHSGSLPPPLNWEVL